MGMRTGTGAHTISLKSRNEDRYTYEHCGDNQRVLAHNKIEIDHKKRGLGSSGPRVPLSGLGDEVHGRCVVAQSSCEGHVILEGFYVPKAMW